MESKVKETNITMFLNGSKKVKILISILANTFAKTGNLKPIPKTVVLIALSNVTKCA